MSPLPERGYESLLNMSSFWKTSSLDRNSWIPTYPIVDDERVVSRQHVRLPEVPVGPDTKPLEKVGPVRGDDKAVENHKFMEVELDILVCRSPQVLEDYQQSRTLGQTVLEQPC